jgi:hypothetical protein
MKGANGSASETSGIWTDRNFQSLEGGKRRVNFALRNFQALAVPREASQVMAEYLELGQNYAKWGSNHTCQIMQKWCFLANSVRRIPLPF